MPSISLPPLYSPSLVFPHGNEFQHQTFCTLFDQGCHVRSIPQMHGTRCIASCYGWLVLHESISTQCYLFNPVSLLKIQLPTLLLDTRSYLICTLSSIPTDPNCFVVIHRDTQNSIIFCRIGDTEWIQQRLIPEDIWSTCTRCCDGAISCNGKVYLLFCGFLAAIDIHNGHLVVSVEPYKQKLFDEDLYHYEVYPVESCGEIFRVCVIRLGQYSYIVRTCHVFKLDLSTMEWVRVENIGQRVFLLGDIGSTSISTNGLVGVKGNCIYLTLSREVVIYMFDFNDETVTTILPCQKEFPNRENHFWFLPNCKLEVNKGVVKLEEQKTEINKDESGSDLPVELLELILSSLSFGDFVRFRLTSKTWITSTSPIKLNMFPSQTVCEQPHQLPWLVSIPYHNKGICNIYHSIFGDVYTINIPALEGATIYDAKYGWLLMVREDTFIFFFNPLTKEIVKLPDLRLPNDLTGLTFSFPPTSSGCIVFGYDRCGNAMVIYCNRRDEDNEDEGEDEGEGVDDEGGGEEEGEDEDNEGEGNEWHEYTCSLDDKNDGFEAADCNPVFYNEAFYLLSKDGKVGLFDLKADEDNQMWKVLNIAPIFTDSSTPNYCSSLRSCLVEDDGHIMSVFVDFRGDPVLVYKLDQSEEKNLKWVKLDGLGNKSLFVSFAASMLVPNNLKGTENRIYFSKFHEENCTFYSLSKGRYQCFKCIYSNRDCKGIREHGNSTWMQLQK